MSEKKAALITGVSSGIGQSIARKLAQKGFTVFGTSRNPQEIEPIPGVEALPLDRPYPAGGVEPVPCHQ